MAIHISLLRVALQAIGLALGLSALAAAAQTDVRVTGTFGAPFAGGGGVHGSFTCTGTPVCTGTFSLSLQNSGCSNAFTLSDTFTMTGLGLTQSGAIQGNVTLAHMDVRDEVLAGGVCIIRPGTHPDLSWQFNGTWNATTATGTFTIHAMGEGEVPLEIPGAFKVDLPPVFPMTVRATIDANTATVAADIQFRPQDVPRQNRLFVFALAPASRVQGAYASGVLKVGVARGGAKADEPVACVLAKANAAGQMTAVSSANLDAYLTGVSGAQGASVSLLNSVPTSNVAGSTFFVGYGPDSATMINTGVNRAVVTIPGSLTCEPAKPQTGWWWNPLEDGRGYSVEVRGNNIFFASFLYDVSGRSTWYVSTGPVSLEGSYYSGELLNATGGQTLGGAYPGRPAISSLGNMTLTFHNEASGTLVWPGGTVPIQRFNIVTNGLNLPAVAGQPESGWWWNPDEDGRGFFMEWQNGWLDIAGYMYDDSGNPVWYLTVGPIGGTSTSRSFSGNWWSYGNGMTLHGPWRQHQQTSSNVAPLTITFSGPDTALMTLPNGRTTNLRRHRF